MSYIKWIVTGYKVRGNTHIKQNKPCQDALLYKELENGAILAVADGHGSSRCTYSEDGAQIAVEVALEVLENYSKIKYEERLDSIRRVYREQIPKQIEKEWKLKVKEKHIKEGRDEETNDNSLYLKYGTTLMCILILPELMLSFQIGDGDMFLINTNEDVKYLIDKDKKLIGNETTSLCGNKAWIDIRTKLWENDKIHDESPLLILVSTDGYSNSFENDEKFLKVGVEYMNIIKEYGIVKVEKNLEDWLNSTSKEGSGDDITLGIICRSDIDMCNAVEDKKSDEEYAITEEIEEENKEDIDMRDVVTEQKSNNEIAITEEIEKESRNDSYMHNVTIEDKINEEHTVMEKIEEQKESEVDIDICNVVTEQKISEKDSVVEKMEEIKEILNEENSDLKVETEELKVIDDAKRIAGTIKNRPQENIKEIVDSLKDDNNQ